MSRARRQKSLSQVRTKLRAADPAREQSPLTSDEVATMRSRLVNEQAEGARTLGDRKEETGSLPPKPRFGLGTGRILVAAAAGTAGLLLALTMAYSWYSTSRGARPTSLAGNDSTTIATSKEGRTRQVNFVTPGGTRVLWTLDSDFEL